VQWTSSSSNNNNSNDSRVINTYNTGSTAAHPQQNAQQQHSLFVVMFNLSIFCKYTVYFLR
jgi:hypothetical protein